MKPIIHRVLLGEKAALYLPFGLAQLKKMERIYKKGFFSQKYFLGGYEIHIEQKGVFQYVRIRPMGGYFEFMTSGKPVETFVTTGTVIPFTGYKAAVVGVSNKVPRIGNGEKAEYTVPNSALGRPTQLGLIDEPVAYASGRLIYEGFPPISPHTGAWLRSMVRMSWYDSVQFPSTQTGLLDRGSFTPFAFRDVDFDIPFQIGAGKSPATRAYVRGDADWPRANGVQTVTHDTYGSRTFGIYNDAFGQFSFFPLSEITAPDGYNQNINPASVLLLKPTLPAWCFVSAKSAMDQFDDEGAAGMVIFPDYDWKFSHDGTKACAVVFERRAATFDSAYYAVDQGPFPWDAGDFDTYVRTQTGALSKNNILFADGNATAAYRNRYSVAPGVVELTFTITLTGPNPQDYSVEIGVAEIRRPTTSEKFTMLAGYSWVDVKATDFTEANQHYEARKGDMVTLDLEYYYRKYGEPTSDASRGPITLMSLRNHRLGEEIRAFPAQQSYGIPEQDVPTSDASRRAFDDVHLVDYDLPTLSFVFHVGKIFSDRRLIPGSAYSPTDKNVNHYTEHIGLIVFTLNRYREALYPETITDFARGELGYRVETSGRALVDASTNQMLLLNELTDWTDAEFAGYRNYRQQGVSKSISPTPATPTAETEHRFAVRYNLADYRGLMTITDPCFGWNVYAYSLCSALHTTEMSSFFAHPDGSWALYDQQYVYNRHGVPTTWLFGSITANTYDNVDLTKFEHCIFDAVRLKNSPATTFRALYNRAVAKGVADGTLVADLQPVELTDLRAVFSKHARVSGSATVAMIGITWGGLTGYYLEGSYATASALASYPFGDQGGTLMLSLGDAFKAAADGTGLVFFGNATPIKFSSAVLV